MNKNISIILITLLGIVVVLLSVGLVLAINGKINYNFNTFHVGSSYCQTLIEEKEFSSIKDLDLSGNSVDIKVEESNTNTIKIELYSDNAKKHMIEEEGNVIKAVLEEKKSGMIFNFKSPYIRVIIPSSYNKTIKTNLSVGDVKVASFDNANLTSINGVGDIKVKSLNKVDVDVKTGDIKIENVKELNASTKTGDIKVSKVKDIYAKTNTGDIKISNIENSMDLSTKTGDVKVEKASIKKDSKATTNIGDVSIKKVSGCYIEGSTSVGDTKINNTDRKSDITLSVKTRVGDIRVN